MNPLDVPDLRRKILYYVIKDKVDKENREMMRDMVDTMITDNWFKYCPCEACTILAHRWVMGLG